MKTKFKKKKHVLRVDDKKIKKQSRSGGNVSLKSKNYWKNQWKMKKHSSMDTNDRRPTHSLHTCDTE